MYFKHLSKEVGPVRKKPSLKSLDQDQLQKGFIFVNFIAFLRRAKSIRKLNLVPEVPDPLFCNRTRLGTLW